MRGSKRKHLDRVRTKMITNYDESVFVVVYGCVCHVDAVFFSSVVWPDNIDDGNKNAKGAMWCRYPLKALIRLLASLEIMNWL